MVCSYSEYASILLTRHLAQVVVSSHKSGCLEYHIATMAFSGLVFCLSFKKRCFDYKIILAFSYLIVIRYKRKIKEKDSELDKLRGECDELRAAEIRALKVNKCS